MGLNGLTILWKMKYENPSEICRAMYICMYAHKSHMFTCNIKKKNSQLSKLWTSHENLTYYTVIVVY